MAVTLKNIAEKVGVSRQAVAAALGMSGSGNVSKDLCEKINKVASEMNYRPNFNARALAGKEIGLIGFLVDNMASLETRKIMTAAENAASKDGYRAMVAEAHENLGDLFSSYQVLKQHGVSGVICLAHSYPGKEKQAEKYFKNEKNIVFVDDPGFVDAKYISIRYDLAIYDAYKFLTKLNKKNIGFIIESCKYYTGKFQQQGFFDAGGKAENMMNLENFPLDDHKGKSKFLEDNIENFIKNNKIDGLIVSNDIYILKIFNVLQKAGYNIPNDISVIGYNNLNICEYTSPTITSIDENDEKIGKALWNLLHNEIKPTKSKEKTPIGIEIKPFIVKRESTCNF